MSQYGGETNPHFLPRHRPDANIPQHIQPEQVQPWDHHPTQIPNPDRIQLRPRPGSQPPTQATRPPRSRPEYIDHVPIPPVHRPQSGEYDYHEPMAGMVRPYPPEHAHQQPELPRHHHQPATPARPHQSGRHSRPVVDVIPVPQPKLKTKPSWQSRPARPHFDQGPRHENLMYPEPNKTKPITWCGAVFCIILWLVIILGGLLVLIVYLVYRPRTPHFEISNVSLNAAYLDMGYFLNSDITVLVNFTNPNKKVNVDFSYVILQLYFEKHIIANQYIQPFSALSAENKLANVEMVSSQVRLPITVTQKLATQIQRNRIMFEVDGIFHARSNFGSLLRYSYWLYGHCNIELTGPPSGIMISSKCRTMN